MLLFLSFNGSGQSHTFICSNRDRFVYLKMENLITVMDKRYSCNKLAVTTDNGTIKLNGECEYWWYPEQEGEGTIHIFALKGKDSVSLGAMKYRVKEIDFAFKPGAVHRGPISADSLLKLKPCIVTDYAGTLCGIHPKILEFSVAVVRNGQILHNIQNYGAAFTGTTLEFFKTLKPADTLIFYQIHCVFPGAISRKMDPAELLIE